LTSISFLTNFIQDYTGKIRWFWKKVSKRLWKERGSKSRQWTSCTKGS